AARESSGDRRLERGVERMIAVAGELPRKLGKPDGHVGPGHTITPALEHEVAFRDLELLGGELRSVADNLARAGNEGAAVADERARAEGAGSDERRAVGIAGAQPHGVRRNAEDIGDDFGKDRLVSLPGCARNGEEIEGAVGGETDRDLFLADRAGRLDEHG